MDGFTRSTKTPHTLVNHMKMTGMWALGSIAHTSRLTLMPDNFRENLKNQSILKEMSHFFGMMVVLRDLFVLVIQNDLNLQKGTKLTDLPRIIENQRQKLSDTLITLCEQNQHLSIATGYWDMQAMELMLPHLENMKSIRLLIGREPMIPRHQIKNPEDDFPALDFKFDLEHIQPSSNALNAATKTIELIKSGQLQVKIYRGSFLHAKTYIFGNFDSDKAVGIIGSSNFTNNGLTQNSELNQLEPDARIVTFNPRTASQEHGHLSWFETFWNHELSELWNEKFLTIIGQSPIGNILFSPYEMYIKTLYEIYQDEIVEEIESSGNLEDGKQLFAFQNKNAQALIRKLNKHGVAMLSDSVGLGKTTTAIEVIKKYLDNPLGRQRIEIITPKSIVSQWEKELLLAGVNGHKPISLQNSAEIEAKRSLDSIASVTLFVIDESHNLRQSNGIRFQQLLDWIRENPKCHVLLMTATPINNNLSDLTNQILLGTGGNANVMKITITGDQKQTEQITFHQAIENLNKKIKQDLKRNQLIDFDAIKSTMIPIIRNFVVRRTRQGITSEYGSLLINGKEQKFPEVIPEVLKYEFDSTALENLLAVNIEGLDFKRLINVDPNYLSELSKTLKHPLRILEEADNPPPEGNFEVNPMGLIFQLILLLGFIPYRWKIYQRQYYGKSREEIRELLRNQSSESKRLLQQLSIYGILRTIFLKRMESSVASLQQSLKNYRTKLDYFHQGILNGEVHSISNLDAYIASLDDEDLEFNENDFANTFETKVTEKDFNLKVILEDIENEKKIINLLDSYLQILEENDPKLEALITEIERLHKTHPNEKVLIFSYFSDTLTYLENRIFSKSKLFTTDNTGFVSTNSKNSSDHLASRFSPKSKLYKLKSDETELKYLFSTDILSEGQNLQDAGILINYDLHWNPVRMIQRNGRINRLGSEFETVRVFNMRPERQLDEHLKLIRRLQGKIDLIRNTIGTDSPVLDEPENPMEFSDSIEDIYSENLNKRLEAIKNAEKAADFLLAEDEFIVDLKKFLRDPDFSEKYREEVLNISAGKWGNFSLEETIGLKRPPKMALAKLISKDGNVGFQFVEVDDNKKQIRAVSQLQALSWLKTTKEENSRTHEKFNLDKVILKQVVEENVLSFSENVVTGSLIGQENDILRLLFEATYSDFEINTVREAFTTTNVYYKRDMAKFKKTIISKRNANQNYQEDLTNIVKLATNIIVNESKNEESSPHLAKLQLVYVANI